MGKYIVEMGLLKVFASFFSFIDNIFDQASLYISFRSFVASKHMHWNGNMMWKHPLEMPKIMFIIVDE